MLLAIPRPLPFALGMAILECLAGKNWALRLRRLGGRTRGAYESFLYIKKPKKKEKEKGPAVQSDFMSILICFQKHRFINNIPKTGSRAGVTTLVPTHASASVRECSH